MKAWKVATKGISGLKDVHGLQLVLHLPDDTQTQHQMNT